jgi:hypothetical protein
LRLALPPSLYHQKQTVFHSQSILNQMKKMMQSASSEIPICAVLVLAVGFTLFAINWQFFSDIQYELNRAFSSYSTWFKGY